MSEIHAFANWNRLTPLTKLVVQPLKHTPYIFGNKLFRQTFCLHMAGFMSLGGHFHKNRFPLGAALCKSARYMIDIYGSYLTTLSILRYLPPMPLTIVSYCCSIIPVNIHIHHLSSCQRWLL